MLDDVISVAWPRKGEALLERRRAEEIVRRVRLFALAFSALTIAWIPVDSWAFSPSRWHDLAVVRSTAALALVVLAMASRPADHGSYGARARLLVLFIIPALFFAGALEIFADTPRRPVANIVAAAYSFVPFVLAAGIATFPLALVESVTLGLLAAAVETWAYVRGTRPFLPFDSTHAFWLLELVTVVAAVAAATQLQMLRALVEQAVRDPLTACLRREGGQALLEQQFRLALRNDASLTLLFADIDRFKRVNDRFGHEAGDAVLAGVAQAFRDCVRQSDVLVRWGGEEFLVILPDADAGSASALIERLRVRGFGRTPDGAPVSMSIGIAAYPADGVASALDLVALGDERMYAAKSAGRDACVGPGTPARRILDATAPVAQATSTLSR